MLRFAASDYCLGSGRLWLATAKKQRKSTSLPRIATEIPEKIEVFQVLVAKFVG
jgi:hypothetical protein